MKRTFPAVKYIFPAVKRTFRGGEYNSGSISSIIYNGYLNNFSIANRSLYDYLNELTQQKEGKPLNAFRQLVLDKSSLQVYRLPMNGYMEEDWLMNLPLYDSERLQKVCSYI